MKERSSLFVHSLRVCHLFSSSMMRRYLSAEGVIACIDPGIYIPWRDCKLGPVVGPVSWQHRYPSIELKLDLCLSHSWRSFLAARRDQWSNATCPSGCAWVWHQMDCNGLKSSVTEKDPESDQRDILYSSRIMLQAISSKSMHACVQQACSMQERAREINSSRINASNKCSKNKEHMQEWAREI